MLFRTTSDAFQSLGQSWCWPHFSVPELACRCAGRFCGGEYWHDVEFLDALEKLRAYIGAPLIINSGHRCDQWNAAVGGAPLSHHKTIAVDISLRRHDRRKVKEAAQRLGFKGVGLANSFIHLDRRQVPARWNY